MSEFLPQPTPPPEARPPASFRFPADYYAASPDEVRPIFPRWVPIGCGWGALAVLLIAFIGGTIVGRIGIGNLMDLVLGSMQDELVSMYAKDVSPDARKALEAELTRLRSDVRKEKTSVAKLDPVMSELRGDIADKQMTSAEVARLTGLLHDINFPVPNAAHVPTKSGSR